MKFLLSLFLVCVFTDIWGQVDSWGEGVYIPFARLSLISLDNQGNLFLADTEGNLSQYNSNGKYLNNFSPQRQGKLSQLEARWTVNIFTFSTDLQEYRILDRFLNPVSENRIPLQLISLAKVATLGNNNIIWVFDEADFTLKQFDYRRNELIQQQPLNLIFDQSSLDIIDIKEYQNLVFLNIKNEGIYILDNQANFLKKLPATVNQKIAFWEDNLIYIENNKLALLNFQSGDQQHFLIPPNTPFPNVMASQYAIYLYNQEGVLIYSLGNSPIGKLVKKSRGN